MSTRLRRRVPTRAVSGRSGRSTGAASVGGGPTQHPPEDLTRRRRTTSPRRVLELRRARFHAVTQDPAVVERQPALAQQAPHRAQLGHVGVGAGGQRGEVGDEREVGDETTRPRGSRSGAPYVASCSRSAARATMPVSSCSSRAAASGRSSPASTKPPGSAHRPRYGSAPRQDDDKRSGSDDGGHHQDTVHAKRASEPDGARAAHQERQGPPDVRPSYHVRVHQ